MTDAAPPATALTGIPADVHCARDYESLSRRFIAGANFDYIAGGSGEDRTLAANLAAFAEWSVCPRLLHEVSTGNTRLHLAGREFAHPVFLAPVAYHALVHPGSEVETARAATAMESCLLASTLSSRSLEEIAAASGANRWFQLYFQPRREATLDLVRRAEAAGYAALVVTLDATIQMPSLRALRAGFRLPQRCVAVNLQTYTAEEPAAPARGESRIFQLMRQAPTWRDLDWLLQQTRLPVWVKGVLHPQDAVALREHGMTGLVVSNHGGRTVDGVPASLRALPAIRAAVGENYPLLFDGGIRGGGDIFKALALGADAVLVGRLQLYALSVAGALGVAHMIRLLREELEICMATAGCVSLADIRRATLFRTQEPIGC
jgi:4-hydroxymandelate oxidase